MRTTILLFLIMASLQLMGEGYQVNLQGQKNTAMGHTGTGFIAGPSIIHFNPGGLGFYEKKMAFNAGVSLIFSNNLYQAPNSYYEAETENPIGTPFYFYGAMRINDKMAVGLGVNTPYGNRLKWEDDWAGRYLNRDIALQAITLQPTFSYKITDWLSVGAGLLVAFNSVELSKNIPVTGTDGDGLVTLEGNKTTFGVNAGLMFKISDELTAGISYRSQMKAKVTDGTATLDVPDALSSMFPEETGFEATLPFPANYNFGLAYQPNDKFMITADINYVQWDVYDSLNFDFEENTENFQDSYNPREYTNSFIYRIGAAYKWKEEVTFRAGAYFDATPIDDNYFTPETPGTDKIGITGGASIRPFENFEIDVSLLYIHGMKRESGYEPDNFEGTFYTNAVIPGVGFTYSF